MDLEDNPSIVHAATRIGLEDIHIECRFSDGQKFSIAQVDPDFPWLAQRIVDMLNAEAQKK